MPACSVCTKPLADDETAVKMSHDPAPLRLAHHQCSMRRHSLCYFNGDGAALMTFVADPAANTGHWIAEVITPDNEVMPSAKSREMSLEELRGCYKRTLRNECWTKATIAHLRMWEARMDQAVNQWFD